MLENIFAVLILVGVGIIIGLIIADQIIFGSFGPWFSHYKKARTVDKPCPHGWENWDECPDCCH